MCPPAVDRERLITASCWRSSSSWILTSRSTIDATGASAYLCIPGGSSAQNCDVFGRTGRFAFLRAMLAGGARLGRSELDQILAGEAGIAEAARLGLDRLVHPLARQIPQAVGGDVLGDLLDRVRGGDQ